ALLAGLFALVLTFFELVHERDPFLRASAAPRRRSPHGNTTRISDFRFRPVAVAKRPSGARGRPAVRADCEVGGQFVTDGPCGVDRREWAGGWSGSGCSRQAACLAAATCTTCRGPTRA